MKNKDINVIKIDSIEQFCTLENEWNKLLEKSLINEPYLTFQWQKAWLNNYAKQKNIYILVVKENNKIIGIAPLIINTFLRIKIIQFSGTGWSDYLNFITGKKDKIFLNAIIEYLFKNKNDWDIIYLSDVIYYNNFEKNFNEAINKNNYRISKRSYYICPYLKITENFEGYLKNKSRNFRRSIKKKKNAIVKLSKKGCLDILKYEKNFEIKKVLHKIYEIETKSWKKEKESHHFRTKQIKSFFECVFEEFIKMGWVNIWIAEFNNVPIAYLISFNYEERIYLYLQAFDNDYQNIGTYLYNYVIEDAFKNKKERIELLRGESIAKKRITDDYINNYQLIIYNSRIKSRIGSWAIRTRWKKSGSEFYRKLYFNILKIKRKINI